jgi:tRNA (cytidine/uridine-2'-O-)-methyltransferase
MLDIVLYEPEIPPNTGNLIRLSANTGSALHLVKPLGFQMNNRRLQRAGLDYEALSHVRVHEDWEACQAHFRGRRIYALSTRGRRCYADVRFNADDVLLFGPETRGLPQALLDQFEEESRLRLPMAPGNRSINLANAVAVVVYEAWRQLDFAGAAPIATRAG